MKTHTPQGAFTIDDFKKWARVGTTTTYEEIKSGRLKVRKLGRKTLILRTDAEEWLNSLPTAAAA